MQLKRTLISSLLLLLPILLYGQEYNQEYIDQQITNAISDVTVFQELRVRMMNEPFELSEQYLLNSQQIVSPSDSLTQMEIYNLLCYAANKQGKYDTAIDYTFQWLDLASGNEQTYNNQIITANINLANSYLNKDVVDSSLFYLQIAETYTEIYNPSRFVEIETRKTGIYSAVNQREKFHESASKLINFLKSENHPESGFILYTIISDVYGHQEWDKYKEYYPVFLDYYRDRVYNTPDGHVPLENFIDNEQEPKLVINNLNELLETTRSNNYAVQVGTRRLLAKKYMEVNQPEKAISILEEYSGYDDDTYFSYEEMIDFTLYEIYKKTNKYDMATLYLEKFVKNNQQRFTEAERSNLSELAVKYETEKKEQALAIQALRIQKANRSKIFLITGIISLAILSSLLYKLFQNRKRSAAILSEKNKKIETALNEKETLLREIHHRVKNNLQVVSSLLSLQSRGLKDIQAKEAMTESKNRVQSMALIHQNLYQDEDLVGVNTKEYIEKLTTNLVKNYSLQKVAVETDIDNINLDVDIMIPLGLILNELITNSLKYAFDESDEGQIQIQLKQKHAGLQLQVSDNGKGFPEGFNQDQLESLGFKLIDAFTKKLKATLKIGTPNKGTLIEILIPNQTLIA